MKYAQPTMMVSLTRVVGEDYLEATVRCVVSSLSLLAIRVPHIVSILLLKLYREGR